MIDSITRANSWLNGYVWGVPMLILLMGTGVAAAVRHGWSAVSPRRDRHAGSARQVPEPVHRRGQRHAISGGGNSARIDRRRRATSRVSRPRSRLADPARSSGSGCPGILGMGTKYAEIVIAMHYRERDEKGVMRGGAMYTLKKRGFGWLGVIFALLTSLAAFGIGNMVQANSVAQSLQTSFGFSASDHGRGAGDHRRLRDPRRHQAHRGLCRGAGALHGDLLPHRRHCAADQVRGPHS